MTATQRVRYCLKTLAAHALHWSGLLYALRRVLLKDKVVVLMYHRVLSAEQRRQTASQDGLIVDVETFRRHMAWLRRCFRILALDEFAAQLDARRPFEGPACLVTFDDGWIDNLRNALPILSAHQIPAVIFLPVSFIGEDRLFTREALTHLLVDAARSVARDRAMASRLEPLLAPFALQGVLAAGADDPLPVAIEAMRRHRYASGPDFDALAQDLTAVLGERDTNAPSLDSFVDWPQVELMARQGITFGGHGADHRVLTEVDPETARYEVQTSRRVLIDRLAVAPTAFAYPNGGWNDGVAAMVKTAGYRLGFTVDAGAVSVTDDPLTLRRVNLHEGMTRSFPMFMARLTGIF